MFKHYILTRFNNGIYDRPDADEWMEERIELFKATKESVLMQEGDFTWVLSFDFRTPGDVIADLVGCSDKMKFCFCHPKDYLRIYGTNAEWVITSRLDNDDWYKQGAVKAIQDRFAPQEMVIDLHYEQWDLETGNRYTSGRKKPNSPFLSLVEKGERPKSCYARPHNKMAENYPVGVFASKKVLAYMVIHGNNIGNQITGKRI